MDNKQTPSPTPPQPAPAQPVAAQAAPQVTVVGAKPAGANKSVLWIILAVMVILPLVGGAYWFVNQQNKTVQEAAPAVSQTPIVQASPTPTTESTDQLSSQLNSLDMGNLDQDFSSVDSSLNSIQ